MQIFSDDVLNKLEQIKKDSDYLSELLTFEEILVDNKLCQKYQKQLDILQPISNNYQNIKSLEQQLNNLSQKTSFDNEQEEQLYKQEILYLTNQITKLQTTILKLIENFNATFQNITVQVVLGSGKFAEQLKNDIIYGYQSFCKQNDFKLKIENQPQTAIFIISGLNAKKIFGTEIGYHIAKQGTQQSDCKVFVIDTFNIVEPTFADNDIKIEVCRSSGAGGQHINTTDSSIKITHLSTGITAICQDERSQFQNKQKALQNLKQKVLQNYYNQKTDYEKQQKAEQIKLIKQNYISKIYDYNNKTIISKFENKKITFEDFLSGKDL